MKTKLIIFLLLLPIFTFSQVTTNPTIPIVSGEITIIFDATGTGLDGYTGDVYAHTGVTVNGAQWQNVIGSWGDNTTQPQLTRDSSSPNLYTLLIAPDIFSFYGVSTSDTVTELSVVFRSSDGTKQTNPDIFITIYAEGLNVAFTNPSNQSVYNLNDVITISAVSSIDADLELFVNNVSQQTATATTTIATSYSLISTGTQTLKVVATANGETKETSISVYVKTPTINSTKPTGLQYGLNKNVDNSVTFLLQAPQKTDVLLLGDFNNWTLDNTYQMAKDGDDFWITLTGLDVNTEFAYQYLVDYTLKVADPYSEKILDPNNDQYIPATTYPNLKSYPTGLTTGIVSTFIINEPTYSWNITNFIKPAKDNLIIYELHIRDFTESDSYNEALTRLDYLESLGINAIELMPISEFEGNDSWGYNPSFHGALDKAYGTKNDFKKFVDECHARGIAIILDVVYNQAFGQSPLAQMYWDSTNNKPAADNPWLNTDATHPYSVGYDFNHESIYTKNYVKQTLKHWINEFKVDGFRIDLSKGFTQTNNPTDVAAWGNYDASRIAILENYANDIWTNTSSDIYLILEHFADNSEETVLANFGFLLWGNGNHNYNQNTMGFASEANISWMSYQERGWNNPNLVGYMESHDEERLMYKNLNFGNSNENYDVKNLNTALAREELAAMFLFTIPGPKMIWQFGELGYEISIDENGRTGRKPLHWEYFDDVNRKNIYNVWSTLIAFKKKQPVFNSTDFNLNVGNLTKSIVLKDASMDIVVIGNFDIVPKTITPQFTQTGTWYEYFTGIQKNVTNTAESITLNPGEYRLYSTVRLLDPRGGTANDDSDGDGIVDTEDLCPNTPTGMVVNTTGCPIFTLPEDNFSVQVVSETCPDKNNGQMIITAQTSQSYAVTINGTAYTFTDSLTVDSLAPGTYSFCITVTGESYEQCFEVAVKQGVTVSGKSSVSSNRATIEIEEGTAPFIIYVNGKEVLETSSPVFNVAVKQGDLLEVKTSKTCEGVYSKSIVLLEGIVAYPNPTSGVLEIALPVSDKEVIISLYSINSQLISRKVYPIINGKVHLNIANKPIGLYIAKVHLDKPVTLKIIKQ
ncbi:alpha-amylase family glycosyl hydrolase [Lutibacter sp.]|uniref:alpha-amylase family glycosyl hydrolase n=1 Tax=Lutibacter sp. TaxID=1925666 RepID=UPI0025BF7509|nr:alpha-amylase family glycosyl hydrolase [Lutibacter sp.]MCF6167954.1 alpha-amylase [Lutibacter sp.]